MIVRCNCDEQFRLFRILVLIVITIFLWLCSICTPLSNFYTPEKIQYLRKHFDLTEFCTLHIQLCKRGRVEKNGMRFNNKNDFLKTVALRSHKHFFNKIHQNFKKNRGCNLDLSRGVKVKDGKLLHFILICAYIRIAHVL